jgi:hypothetical protein
MEIIEKQIEKVKEVPAECYNNWGYGKYGFRPASRGVAGAGLGLK